MRPVQGAKLASPYAEETVRRLRVNPQDPDALFASAAIVAARGQFGRAIQLLDTLALVAPRYPGLWRFKARLYREVGDRRMEGLCLVAARREDLRAKRLAVRQPVPREQGRGHRRDSVRRREADR